MYKLFCKLRFIENNEISLSGFPRLVGSTLCEWKGVIWSFSVCLFYLILIISSVLVVTSPIWVLLVVGCLGFLGG